MISDYERTLELVNAANNSAGASNAQFEKTLDSLESKLKKLKNAWDSFSMGIMNSDFIKFGVDALTELVTILDKASQGFGSITGIIGKAGMIYTVFQVAKKLLDQLLIKLGNEGYKQGQRIGEGIAAGMTNGINQAKEATEGITTEEVATTDNTNATDENTAAINNATQAIQDSAQQQQEQAPETETPASATTATTKEIPQDNTDRPQEVIIANGTSAANPEDIEVNVNETVEPVATEEAPKGPQITPAVPQTPQEAEVVQSQVETAEKIEAAAESLTEASEKLEGSVEEKATASAATPTSSKPKTTTEEPPVSPSSNQGTSNVPKPTGFAAVTAAFQSWGAQRGARGEAKTIRRQATEEYDAEMARIAEREAAATRKMKEIEGIEERVKALDGLSSEAISETVAIIETQRKRTDIETGLADEILPAFEDEDLVGQEELVRDILQASGTKARGKTNADKEAQLSDFDSFIGGISESGLPSASKTEIDSFIDDLRETVKGNITVAGGQQGNTAFGRKRFRGTVPLKNAQGEDIPGTARRGDFDPYIEIEKLREMLYARRRQGLSGDKITSPEQVAGAEKAGKEAAEARKAAEQELQEARTAREAAEAKKNEAFVQAEQKEAQALNKAKEAVDHLSRSTQFWGQSLVGVGVAATALSQGLRELGADEDFVKVVENIGKGLTTIGSVMMGLPPILNILKTTLASVGTTGAKAGTAVGAGGAVAQAGWWPLLVIALALVATFALLGFYLYYIKKNSPEGKLASATDEAERAAQAASSAAEAYENLNTALDKISEKYDAIDGMVKGTQEWRDSIIDTNAEVLDLIDQFPKLATAFENVDGVLRVKEDGGQELIDEVLKEQEDQKTYTQMAEMGAKLQQKIAQDNLYYDELSDNAKYGSENAKNAAYIGGTLAGIGGGATGGAFAGAGIGAGFGGIGAIPGTVIGGIVGGVVGGVTTGVATHAIVSAALAETEMSDQERTEQIAKALASGEIEGNGKNVDALTDWIVETWGLQGAEDVARGWAESLSKGSDELVKFGNQLITTEQQTDLYHQSVAQSAATLVDTTAMTEKQIEQMFDMAGKDYGKYFIDEAKDDFSNLGQEAQQSWMREWARKTYGDDVSVDKKGNIVDAEGNIVEEMTKEAWATQYANEEAADDIIKALEKLPQAFAKITSTLGSETGKSFEKLFTDEGLGATQADIERLSGEDPADVWKAMSDEERAAWNGDEDLFANLWTTFKENANKAFQEIVKFEEETAIIINKNLSAGAAKGYKDNLEKVIKTSGETSAEKINAKIQELTKDMTDEDLEAFYSQLNAVTWDNKESVAGLSQNLIELGVVSESARNDLNNLEIQIMEAADAVHSMDFSTMIAQLQKLQEIANAIYSGEQGRVFDSDTYSDLTKYNPDLAGAFMPIVNADGSTAYVYTGDLVDLARVAEKSAAGDIADARADAFTAYKETAAFREDVKDISGAYITEAYTDDYRKLFKDENSAFDVFMMTMPEEARSKIYNELLAKGVTAEELKSSRLDTSEATFGDFYSFATGIGARATTGVSKEDFIEELDSQLKNWGINLSPTKTRTIGYTGEQLLQYLINERDTLLLDEDTQKKLANIFGFSNPVDLFNFSDEIREKLSPESLKALQEMINDGRLRNSYAYSESAQALYNTDIVAGDLANEVQAEKDKGLETRMALYDAYDISDYLDGYIEDSTLLKILATDLAMNQQKFDNLAESAIAFTDVLENSNKGSYEYITGLEKMRRAIAGAFGVELAEEWEQTHADLIERFVKGEEGAFEELQQTIIKELTLDEAQNSIIKNIETRLPKAVGEAVELTQKELSGLNNMSNEELDRVAQYYRVMGYQLNYIRDAAEGTTVALTKMDTATSLEEIAEAGEKLKDAWENPYTWLDSVNSALETQIRLLEKLDREYNRLLENSEWDRRRGDNGETAGTLADNIRGQMEALGTRADVALSEGIMAQGDMENYFKELENKGYGQFIRYDPEKGTMIDWKAVESAGLSPEQGDELTEIVDNINKSRETYEDSLDTLNDIEDNVIELRDQGRDAKKQLFDQIRDAIVDTQQAEIDEMQSVSDAIREAQDSLVSKMQEQIDDERQARENEKTEQDLRDKRNRLAYLKADVGGGNAVEIAQLEKELADAEEQYQDTLIDQALADLQEANEKAAEQREEQIEIARTQLDIYKESNEIWAAVGKYYEDTLAALDKGEDIESTPLGKLLSGTMGNLSQLEKQDFWTGVLSNLEKASVYDDLATDENVATMLGTIQNFKEFLEGLVRSLGDGTITAMIPKDLLSMIQADLGPNASAAEISKWLSENAFALGTDMYKTSEETPLQTALSSLAAGQITSDEMKKNLKEFGYQFLVEDKNNAAPTISKMRDGKDEGQIVFNWDFGSEQHQFLAQKSNNTDANALASVLTPNEMFVHNDILYVAQSDGAYEVSIDEELKGLVIEWLGNKGISANLAPKTKFKTGGLADFTGPAWLDGTPSKPEYILNADQTARFFELIDVLGNIKPTSGETSHSDSYFDIDIHVNRLDNDYDVEQMANKIRSMIYEDATYRNVNAINQIR